MTSPYLYGWSRLSQYLDDAPIKSLETFEKEGLIKKYKLGRKVMFKREEIDNAIKPVEK